MREQLVGNIKVVDGTLKPNAGSNRTWVWALQGEHLALKFASREQALEFREAFDGGQMLAENIRWRKETPPAQGGIEIRGTTRSDLRDKREEQHGAGGR